MKTDKLREAVENVTSVSEAYDLMLMMYEVKNHNFHMCRQPDSWHCRVMKVKKVANGKDVEYKESFLLQEKGSTFEEAFKMAAKAYLK